MEGKHIMPEDVDDRRRRYGQIDGGNGERQTHDRDEDFHPWRPHPCIHQRGPHNEGVLLDGHVLSEWLFDFQQQTHELVNVMHSSGHS
jgi:hypothetical protein